MKEADRYILGITDDFSMIGSSDEGDDSSIKLTRDEDVKNIVKKRIRDSHKGTYGRVGILSGSKGMAGACVLNLNAALRSGAGLVKGCVTNSIYSIVESMAIEATTYSFDEENINYEDLSRELISFSDVVATGSGCSNMKNYRNLVRFLIKNSTKPLVIDAEGINQLNISDLEEHKQNIILTPHYGEMARLIKKDINYIREDIIEKSTEFSSKYNLYLVLKGARTLICCPNGKAFINTSGNPGMATAGSGDVLTGIIASLIGQKIEIQDALRAAVYLHGSAGDIGAKNVGEYSLIASDIIRYLPEAFKAIN